MNRPVRPPPMPAPSQPPRRPGSLARFVDLAFRDRSLAPVSPAPAPAPAPGLSHHQILEIAAPFSRHGHALDLAASDRAQRRLVFRSTCHEATTAVADGGTGTGTCAAPPPASPLHERLELRSPRPGWFRLTRTLRHGAGLEATLWTEGDRPGELLARVQSVPRQLHFDAGPRLRLARSGCVVAAAAGEDPSFRMTQAVVETDEMRLQLQLSAARTGGCSSATWTLWPRRPATRLPTDLLAVLGWDWSLLRSGPQGFEGSVRLRGGLAGRARDAERKLRRAATHLTRTLADTPPRFHERCRQARGGVLLRQALPLIAGLLLALQALFAEALRAANGSTLTLALLCIPPALMLLYLLRSEDPRLAWPAWPRPLAPQDWQPRA